MTAMNEPTAADRIEAVRELLQQAEQLARYLRVASEGKLTLGPLAGERLAEHKPSMFPSWQDAYEYAMRELKPAEPAMDLESLAREMFPAEYKAITDDHPMDPAKVQAVVAELERRRSQ